MLKSLLEVVDALVSNVAGVPECDLKEFYKTNPEHIRLMVLWHAYRDAFDNPPEGVIGVGKITYAEHMLMEAQNGNR